MNRCLRSGRKDNPLRIASNQFIDFHDSSALIAEIRKGALPDESH